MGKFDYAIGTLEIEKGKFLQLHPDNYFGTTDCGIMWKKIKELQQAIELLEKENE